MIEGQPESSTALDQDVFVVEFRRWRDVRGLSRSALAQRMGYSRSYVSKIERGGEHPSRDFAVAADTALNAGGAIRRAWRDQEATHVHHEAAPKPSETMSALGIVQQGELILRRPARLFSLPIEAEDARRVISELSAAAQRVAAEHTFGKGMGIAAPQIGIERSAAIVRPPGTHDVITLLNPRIIEASDDTDEQYEGCLSFFDVRCLVRRALVIHVEHQDINGERRIAIFERGIARLVAHEMDHLRGILCQDHLPPGVQPIPVEQYRGTGTGWQYHERDTI